MRRFWCACQPRSANLLPVGVGGGFVARHPPQPSQRNEFASFCWSLHWMHADAPSPLLLRRLQCFPFQLCLCVPTRTFFSLICGLPEFCNLCGAFFSMCTFCALVRSVSVLGCVSWLMWWVLKGFLFSIPRSLVGPRSTADVKGGCRTVLWGRWSSQEGGLVDDC